MGHKGHWGEYTGNAKWSRDHAHTRVTSKNYDDAVRDDAAHIDYLKRDINYDAKHGHNDENMTADEKHISKLAGDMKYDKKHHGMSMSALPAHRGLEKKLNTLKTDIKKAQKQGLTGERADGTPYEDIARLEAQIKEAKAAHKSNKTEEDAAQIREDEDAARASAAEMHCMGKK